MNVGDCMKRKVVSSPGDITFRRAAEIMVQKHIGVLPIVDENSRLIGLVRLRDLITLALPEFAQLVKNVDFIHDFGAVEDEKPDSELLDRPVNQILGEPVSVEESAGLIRAIALLQEHMMYDLPVVDDDMHLVGVASYVDIGVALMTNWNQPA